MVPDDSPADDRAITAIVAAMVIRFMLADSRRILIVAPDQRG
jgi:hypothetical protein